MKKVFYFSLLALSLCLVTSCQKDQTDIKEIKSNKVAKTDTISWTIYYDGQLITNYNSIGNIAAAFSDCETMTTYNFSTITLFHNWANIQNYSINGIPVDIVEIDTNLDSISNYAINTEADEYYELTGQIRSDVIALMDALLPKFDKETQTKNTVRKLYDFPYLTDQIHISTYAVPTFGNANNRAESIKEYLFGIDTFCDYTWWRGPKHMYLVGGIREINTLGNWANRYESAVAM